MRDLLPVDGDGNPAVRALVTTHPATSPAVVVAVPLRIRHVDSLRAVAALLVIWYHFYQIIGPLTGKNSMFLSFLRVIPRTIDLGRMAIMMFFAVSGFVIFRSFDGPRRGGVRRFLIRRCCRLYPAYWVSMLGGILVWLMHEQAWDATILVTNATMFPSWLDQPRLLGVYWTLEIELLFYGCCLILYLARSLERRGLLAAFIIVLAGLTRALRLLDHHFGTHLALAPGHPTLALSLAIMFWGALFRMAYDETGGFRKNVWRCPGVWLVAILGVALIDLPDPNMKWFLLGLWTGPLPGHLSVLAALLTFAVWVACLRIDHPVMTYLGVISYSLYLFHPVVLYATEQLLLFSETLRGWDLPFWVYLLAGGGWTIAIAAGVYRWVEKPAIALGKRWAGIHRDTFVTDRTTPAPTTG